MDEKRNKERLQRALTIATLLLVGFASASRAQPVSPAPRGVVHLSILDAFGKGISEQQILEVNLSSTDVRDAAAHDRTGLTYRDLKYGTYAVRVLTKGGSYGEGKIIVNSPEMWVRIGLVFPLGDRDWPGGGLVIRGKVAGASTTVGRPLWARAVGISLDVIREVPVNFRRQFTIQGLEMGAYVIEILDGTRVRYAQTIEIDSSQSPAEVSIFLK